MNFKRVGAIVLGAAFVCGCDGGGGAGEGSGTMKQSAPQEVPKGYGDMKNMMDKTQKEAMEQRKGAGGPGGMPGNVSGGPPSGAGYGQPGAAPGSQPQGK